MTGEAPADPGERQTGRAARLAPLLIAAAVFASFLLYYGLCAFRTRWGADFQMYCAGVARLYRDFLHPAHESMAAPGAESTVYTLYLVLVGGLGRLLGATPYRALQIAGLVNLVLYAAAIRYFVSRTSMHRHTWLASACFLLVTLFMRWDQFGWSSETSVLTMAYIQAYPSTAAWAMAFAAFALVEDFHRARRLRHLIGLGGLLCALLLTHLITASWVIGIVLLRGLHLLVQERAWRFPLLLLAAVGAALALAALWPYSSFLDQGSMTGVREPSRFGRHPLSDFANLYLVAIPCAIWLIARVRRHLFFATGFAATFAALELWQALGITYGNRYSFFMAFFAQFLVAEAATAGLLAIASALPLDPERARPAIDRPVALALLAAIALAWLPSPMWQVARKKPLTRLASPAELLRRASPHDAYYHQFDGVPIEPADIVLMPVSRSSYDLASVTGAAVVVSPNAYEVADESQRLRDIDRFFEKTTTPPTRRLILARYCPTRLLLPRAQFALLPALTQELGPPAHQDRRQVLFSLPPCSR